MECLLKPGIKVLVLAIGGGGDIASAAVIARSLAKLGVQVVLASVAWERYIYDPVPGPIKLSEIQNAADHGEHYVVVTGDSYAVRAGRKIVFQAAKAARAIGGKIYVVDLYGGVEGYVKALNDIAARESVNFIVGVDVGGDSLATGCEDDLWSPLADWVGLAALSRVKGILAVHSPGSDGELDSDYLLRRIDDFARKGGLLGVRSMCREDAEFLSTLLRHVNSEASRIPLVAYAGQRGEVELRNGSRKVKLTLMSTFTFFLDARVVAESIEPVKALYSTRSLEEARDVLNSYGIYTELDLEEDLARLGLTPELITGDLLLEIRRQGASRVKKSKNVEYCYD